MTALDELSKAISACRICRDSPSGKPLPHEPRPVFQADARARLLIAGQAPGTRVHASGRPFTDPSGDRLRQWLGIGPQVFYDPAKVLVIPMGFCFPGQDERGADLPPRRECAPAWRNRLMAALPQIELVIALGAHAQKWHMATAAKSNLTDTVRNWREALLLKPAVIPMPHPSWRNNAWLKANPWFIADVIPEAQRRVRELTG
ncbi:MAG: uracil-DNA glycosylase family protein [Rhizobiales bacterium]|nr:uracil-DNA glycosylase family protein [Hyphomicrobiales bacterium]